MGRYLAESLKIIELWIVMPVIFRNNAFNKVFNTYQGVAPKLTITYTVPYISSLCI